MNLILIIELTEAAVGLPDDDDIFDEMNLFPCFTSFKSECSIVNE